VIRDIITTVSRRFPGIEIVLYPTKVQGEGASSEVVANIQRANQRDDLDVLIIGRGGGSIEDLWAFNEEAVVRAIFESRIPIISSVGHETDTTLADFVADRRAATPTAAAELATPVTKLDLLSHLQKQENRMATAMSNRLAYNRERLAKLSQSVIFRQPERLYDGYLQKIDQLQGANQLQGLRHRLEAMSPLHRIERYQDRLLQDKRILTNRMEQVLKEQKIKVQGLSEALLMLDTSRIIARGYAMVSTRFGCKSNRRGLAVPHHERWPVRSRGKTCRKKRNLKKI